MLYITKGQVVHGAGHMHTQTDTQTKKLIDSSWSRTLQGVKTQSLLASGEIIKEKSHIRETKHLSTDAESSTDTTIGWTKNTKKPEFLKNRKKSCKTLKLKNV